MSSIQDKLIPINLEEEMKRSFISYAMAVIIDRALPEVALGDLLIIHDTGAHGFSMGYNYNGKLRSAELLLQEDGTVKLIRRAETPEDYFATMLFE